AFSNLWYKPKFILRRAPWAFIQVVLTRHFPTFGINQNLFYAVAPWAFMQVVGTWHFKTFGINQNLFYAVPLGIYASCRGTAFSNLWYKPKFILRRAPGHLCKL
ncbi:hypothetical protein, partial [Microseira wollei]|uniref:hypothetical protein n=1 Tax=Microseira wollei TaxID=467598 RepID=UPI001CFDD1A2